MLCVAAQTLVATVKICLDFDGVLHDAAHPVPGRKMGPPCDGALECVKQLLRHGHELVVETARVHNEERALHVHDWLAFYGFPALPISIGKPMADVYLDDKGLHHIDWDTSMSAIKTIARKWER